MGWPRLGWVDFHHSTLLGSAYAAFFKRGDSTGAALAASFGSKAFIVQEETRKAMNNPPISSDPSIRLFTVRHLFSDHDSFGVFLPERQIRGKGFVARGGMCPA